LHKGEVANGQLFFVGDLNHRLAMYSAQCASPSRGDLPCEALPKLTDLSGSAGATFRLEREKLIVFLMAQFEWSINGLGLQTVIADDTPRIRLISFRSKLDGTTQLYYLHASPDVQSGEPQPLVVVEPFNGNPKPFFDSPPTTTNLALDRYARFADQYHLSYIAPFGRGKLLPSPLAEKDVLEAIEDARQRIKVDNSRIYLTGECAAGRSALLMAEDYPEMFAAVSTLSAATHEYAAATNSEWDSANALLRLRNLSSMPIRLIHGSGDFHSPSPQASLLLQEAHKVGVYPEMMWLPGDSKFGVIEPQRAMFEFFATVKSRQPAVPSHVALAVTENAHNHEFWIQVDQRRLDNTPAYITGEISARNRIKITSSNVQKVTIDLQKLPIDPSKKRTWTVVCNGGQKQRLQADASEQIVLNIAAD
jgi:dienelactone hydrolase